MYISRDDHWTLESPCARSTPKKQTEETKRERERENTNAGQRALRVTKQQTTLSTNSCVLHESKRITAERQAPWRCCRIRAFEDRAACWRGRATRGYEVGEAEPKPRRKERRKGAVSRTDGMVGSHVSARCPVSTQPTWDLPYLALPRHTMPSLPSRATLARVRSDFSFLAYSPYGRTIARR